MPPAGVPTVADSAAQLNSMIGGFKQDNKMFRGIPLWIALGLIAAVVLVSATYLWNMNRAYERVRGKSTVIPSLYGDIEYTAGGSGTAVLVIHGSGGGYDQGELLVRAVLGEQFHWITPSRFGYLRSTFREGATFDDQAHAPTHICSTIWVSKKLQSSLYPMAALRLSSLPYCNLNGYPR
jgi:hypothetical protein